MCVSVCVFWPLSDVDLAYRISHNIALEAIRPRVINCVCKMSKDSFDMMSGRLYNKPLSDVGNNAWRMHYDIFIWQSNRRHTIHTHTHTRPHSPKILRVFHMHRPTMTEVSNNFGNLPTTARANYFNLNHYNIVFGGQNHNTMHRYAISGGEGGGGAEDGGGLIETSQNNAINEVIAGWLS